MSSTRLGPILLAVAVSIVPIASPASAAAHGPVAARGSAASLGSPRRSADLSATPTTAQLIGQKLMVAMAGTTPSAALLGRISRGEVGGVILFGSNIASAAQLTGLTAKLRAAASSGGQPPLLIATDQEGGSVRRLPWAAPTLTVPQMGALDSATTTRAQGQATGLALSCAGVNNDLAPVADVPASTASFMYQQGRTWSFSASVTASMSDAFASGLEAAGDVPTMKHFPGIGFATANTDSHVVTISATRSQLAPGLTPYQTAIGHGLPMVMLSNATYSAYDAANAAGWSHAISVDLLRTTLGFTGVSITDSLSGTAAARGVTATSLAIKAAAAGTDMILLTGSESATAAAYSSLVSAATAGTIPASLLQASYARIVALKASMAPPTIDTTAPSARPPIPHLRAGTTLGTSTVPIRTIWSATDPCGISGYSLRHQVNGGSWFFETLPSPQAAFLDEALTFGTDYRYEDRATDGAGNTSSFVLGPAFRPVVSQETSAAITYAGGWSRVTASGASGGSVEMSTANGASATFTAMGLSLAWVAYRGPDRGQATVSIDGGPPTTIDLYASSASPRPIVFGMTWAVSGSHSIRIVNLGTAGHARVDVDAFARLYALP